MTALNYAEKLRLGSKFVDRAYVGTTKVWPQTEDQLAWFTPTTGGISTPDPGVPPTTFTLVSKLRGPFNAAVYNTLAAQYPSSSGRSWHFSRRADTETYAGRIHSSLSENGTTWKVNTVAPGTGLLPINYDYDEELAVAIDITGAVGTARIQVWEKLQGIWQRIGNLTTVYSGSAPVLFDSSAPVTIGASGDGTSNPFDGRIYSVEMRTGLVPNAGTVLWRFDANDYPGSGMEFTDPRGRVWTMTNPTSITLP
jgi:hypothetical protein